MRSLRTVAKHTYVAESSTFRFDGFFFLPLHVVSKNQKRFTSRSIQVLVTPRTNAQ